MAQAAKSSREESEHRVSGFSLLEPVGKLRAYPRRLRQFLHEVRVEMRQVTWPSRHEVLVHDVRGDRDGGVFRHFFLRCRTALLVSRAASHG